MNISDFNYNLPPELIAQTPIADRQMSRLLVLEKKTGAITHKIFKDIVDYLNPGDCLVLNDTRVLPARLFGQRDDSKAIVEFVLLKQIDQNNWETMVRPGKKAREGKRFTFGDGLLKAEIVELLSNGNRKVKFEYDGQFMSILDKIGLMPLPPYIKEKLADKERYQTVYSKNLGSAAAPTAGLHFTNGLLEEIGNKGIKVVFLTLHVGIGTFRPVKVDIIENHKMHSEYYSVSKEAADTINACKNAGGRIVAVGTTSCRTLETVADNEGIISPESGNTKIFIYPGYKFKAVDALITNFHLPESTLLMLVSALAGRDNILAAYNEAILEKYRFFSFGDAMLII